MDALLAAIAAPKSSAENVANVAARLFEPVLRREARFVCIKFALRWSFTARLQLPLPILVAVMSKWQMP